MRGVILATAVLVASHERIDHLGHVREAKGPIVQITVGAHRRLGHDGPQQPVEVVGEPHGIEARRRSPSSVKPDSASEKKTEIASRSTA